MKTMNYIKIGIASSILSIAAGCTSFLEEDLKSSLAPDNTYTSSQRTFAVRFRGG